MDSTPRQYRFPARCRLHGRRAFAAVYAAKVRKNAGPLALYARPNDLGYLRLGLSASRQVGSAVVRNRIKRQLREAFRLSQHDWPVGYDVVVVIYAHPPAALAEYQRLLSSGIRSLHLEWQRRQRRAQDNAEADTPPG